MKSDKPISLRQKMATKLFLGILRFLSWLPLSWAQSLGKMLGTLLYWLPNNSRFLAQSNLNAVYPNLPIEARNKLVKQVLQHNAQAMLELGGVWFWSENKIRNLIKEEHGKELIDEAYAQGKGVLVLSPHMGSWEMMGAFLSLQYPATYMFRPPKSPELEKVMTESRSRFGAKLVPTNVVGIKQIVKALKQNQVSMILPDQDAGKNGVHAPFMGIPARTMTLASKLLKTSDAACVYMVILRRPQGGFAVHYLPADRDALMNKDLVEAATALNEGVERCVEMATEQYLWTYRRFRGQPEGMPNIYQK